LFLRDFVLDRGGGDRLILVIYELAMQKRNTNSSPRFGKKASHSLRK
jgi:hypothetical protein